VKFYRKKTVIVDAYQVTEPTKVKTMYGTVNANITDWVLKHTEGNVTVLSDEFFQIHYEPVFQGSEEQ
jgi:hypothetical protein